jgi:hypothetical protein
MTVQAPLVINPSAGHKIRSKHRGKTAGAFGSSRNGKFKFKRK